MAKDSKTRYSNYKSAALNQLSYAGLLLTKAVFSELIKSSYYPLLDFVSRFARFSAIQCGVACIRLVKTPDRTTAAVFARYGPGESSYSYTKVGRIDDASELAAAVGSGNVTVRFESQRNDNLPRTSP
jgi:hypothetical protein